MIQIQTINPRQRQTRINPNKQVKALVRSSGVAYLGGFAIPSTTKNTTKKKKIAKKKSKPDIYGAISKVVAYNKPLGFDAFLLELACKINPLPGDVYSFYKYVYLPQVQ